MNNDIPKNIGIYKITCLANSKVYIGGSVNLKNRIRQHKRRLRKNKHCNSSLQNDYNKFGLTNFTYEILKYCFRVELPFKEMYYIVKYNTFNEGYNVSIPKEIDFVYTKLKGLTCYLYDLVDKKFLKFDFKKDLLRFLGVSFVAGNYSLHKNRYVFCENDKRVPLYSDYGSPQAIKSYLYDLKHSKILEFDTKSAVFKFFNRNPDHDKLNEGRLFNNRYIFSTNKKELINFKNAYWEKKTFYLYDRKGFFIESRLKKDFEYFPSVRGENVLSFQGFRILDDYRGAKIKPYIDNRGKNSFKLKFYIYDKQLNLISEELDVAKYCRDNNFRKNRVHGVLRGVYKKSKKETIKSHWYKGMYWCKIPPPDHKQYLIEYEGSKYNKRLCE